MGEPDKIETEIVLEVPQGYREGERLDRYISGFVLNATRSKVQKAIRDGRVTVNSVVTEKVSYTVSPGDRIVCRVLKPPPIETLPEAIPLDIRYEDADVLVVNKPAGMVVHPAYGNRTGTLVNALLHYTGSELLAPNSLVDEDDMDGDEEPDGSAAGLSNLGLVAPGDVVRPGIVHRLDKDTSGLLVVAKHDVAHARLAAQFADRTISRKYVAIVWGSPKDDEGVVDEPIGRSPRDRKKMAVLSEPAGKRAVTHFTVATRMAHTAVLHLWLETGRTHQIRVHLQRIGHPIFGDKTYGGDTIRSGPETRSRSAFMRNLFAELPRQALHAAQLRFLHPMSGKGIEIEAPVPEDMAFVLHRLSSVEP
ncbi:MAG: RluA family pseudouridine synthase [Bacteroidetes bacterium]|nr:RluA family pseudouridine synthase [Bacteroidota bacterium]